MSAVGAVDMMRATLFALALLLVAARASAERQIKPFLGVTFGGGTTIVDLEHASGKPNGAVGVSAVLLGDLIGVDADFGYAPGFFQSGPMQLVLRSSVMTLTGNIVLALPRRLTEYTLRPYVVGGGGIIRARTENSLSVLQVASTLPAMDLGGGVTGFVTDQIGLNWEVRHFRSVGKGQDSGLSFGGEQLSFWRASMAFAVRY